MERHIDPFLGDVHVAVGHAQAHLNIGIGVLEVGDMGRDEPFPHAQRRGHEDRAARVVGDGRHGGFGLGNRLQDICRALIVRQTVLGRMDAPGRAVEQANAEMFFELGDPARGDGR